MPPGLARERVLCSRGGVALGDGQAGGGEALGDAHAAGVGRRGGFVLAGSGGAPPRESTGGTPRAMLALLAAFALAVPRAQGVDALRPPIVQRPIPFGA